MFNNLEIVISVLFSRNWRCVNVADGRTSDPPILEIVAAVEGPNRNHKAGRVSRDCGSL